MSHDLEPSLQGIELVRSFGEGPTKVTPVNSVTIDLYPGKVTLLMGPSGSGKTTLLAILSGLLSPHQGQVMARGEDLWGMTEKQREAFRLKNCGFVFQGYNLFPALTARQQLEMVLRWGSGQNRYEARTAANKMLADLGLATKGDLRPIELSGGEKQRVAIGRALIKKPKFFFADEPTSALDWKNGEKVLKNLRNAAHVHGATVLLVAHDTRIIQHGYADHVIHMEDGQLKEPEDAASYHPVRSTIP